MLTTAKLQLYQQYDGDADGFARAGSAAQRAAFPSKEWAQLTELLENVRLENAGLLADSFRQRLHRQLAAACDGPATVELLRQIAQPTRANGRRPGGWLVLTGALLLTLLAGYLLLNR